MRPYRPGGRALSRRLVPAVFLFTSLALSSTPAPLHGAERERLVVDPDGRPLPRAHVRLLDSSDQPILELFADDLGRFRLDTDDSCQVEASMPGFLTTRVSCASGDPRIALPVAPIQETVVVTATRTEAPASQVGAATTAFTAEEIARRQTPLVSELVRSSPGAMVLQTGGLGGITALFVRGGESTYNTVLLDGIPINEPGGTFNFNNLTTENVERVEVVRGANSALFGSDAMSSVVQLFTKRGLALAARPQVSAQIDGGSYGTMRTTGSVAGATGGWDYSLAASRLSTDNRVPNAAFGNTTVSANLGRALDGRTTVRGIVRAELGRNGVPGQTAYGRPDLDASLEQHQVFAGLTLDQRTTRNFRQRVSYSSASTNQASRNLVEDAPFTPAYDGRVAPFEWTDFLYDSRNRLRRYHASYQADWHVAGTGRGDHRITALVDWTGERARLEDLLTGESTRPSRNNYGAAVQHQLLWKRVSTSIGARIEKNASFGTAAVPRASAVYTAREGRGNIGDTRLRAVVGLGIKEPTLLQSFSLSPFFAGNPNLRPERSRSMEVGIEQRFASDRLKLEATWFGSRYRNIIGLRTTEGFFAEYVNVGLTQARGAELSAELAPHRSVRVRGGYTFLDSEIVESTSEFSPVFAAGQSAFRRPRHSGFVSTSWNLSRLTVDVNGTFVGQFVDSDFASLEPSITRNMGWTTWDGRASWRLTPNASALFAVDNIGDRDYQQPLGYLALRRAVRAGLRVTF
ncbi:MAG: TonB-dependent receptor [Vicinamibacterales bacterium]